MSYKSVLSYCLIYIRGLVWTKSFFPPQGLEIGKSLKIIGPPFLNLVFFPFSISYIHFLCFFFIVVDSICINENEVKGKGINLI